MPKDVQINRIHKSSRSGTIAAVTATEMGRRWEYADPPVYVYSSRRSTSHQVRLVSGEAGSRPEHNSGMVNMKRRTVLSLLCAIRMHIAHVMITPSGPDPCRSRLERFHLEQRECR